MIFDFIINSLESIFIFFIVSFFTWKYTDSKVLKKPYLCLRIIISILFVITVGNFFQFVSVAFLPVVWGKFAAIVLFIFSASIMFCQIWGNRKNFFMYIIVHALSFLAILLSEVLVLLVAFFISKDIIVNLYTPSYYYLLSVISIIAKYSILSIAILIFQPVFFKNLFKGSFQKSLYLTASTVTYVSKSQAKHVSWFFFYQPKTPKCLSNKMIEKVK